MKTPRQTNPTNLLGTALLLGASTANLCAATFSDDQWTGMSRIPGANGVPGENDVRGAVVDGSGNPYIGTISKSQVTSRT